MLDSVIFIFKYMNYKGWQKRLQRTTSWWSLTKFGFDRMGYKVQQNCKLRQDGLQNAPEITNCDKITKRDGTKPPPYVYCLIVKFIISRFIVWIKFFLMICNFLGEYIIADMIPDIFKYTFLINVPLSFLQYHTNKNSSFKNS